MMRTIGVCMLLFSLGACGGPDAAKVEALEKRVTQLERKVKAMEGRRRGGDRARAGKGGRNGGPAARRPGQGGRRGPGPAVDPATLATVKAEGDAGRVVLVSENRRVRLPGRAPEGTYRILAGFSDGQPVEAGEIELQGGQEVTLTCTEATRSCTVE